MPRSPGSAEINRGSGPEALNGAATRRLERRRRAEAAKLNPSPAARLPVPPLDTGMQNPSGQHPTPAPAGAGKSKSSAQAAAAASSHDRQPSPATPVTAKSKSSAQVAAAASGHGHHSSPVTPAATKSKSSAHAAASGQPSSSHHHHSGGAPDAAASSLKRKRGMFQKDLQHMMYGFGDDPNPLPETVTLVEDIVVEYVTDLVHKAQNVASKRGKLLTEDFLYLIRKDMRKLHRATELLSMNEELKQARKAFDVNEETLVVTNE
ncbi:transcription initiation protein SPT3 homolog [Brachypodium distachyon]|uniref:Transcription initiation factor TFIID subunit 13 n=2 Tax=Pooideae TaxID=147368 RepID=A0A0Q3H1T8_BRADI|nr:transcription initiation protein SPT3 homolog [Brachypodium distachyon]KQK16896.1 hypothetical protein BRADI_1g31307v3 [Brachypodium distachyon]|eukprot:XP_003560386.2 transcription initiation protein SPT3 homolog [Brachypodium distachyon]